MTVQLAFDPGFSSIKLYGPLGPLILPSSVATATGEAIRPMSGLRLTRPPLRVETEAGSFYAGQNAHDWGRPIENLDFDRLSGTPEMRALFFGALSRYGVRDEEIDLIVGLPIGSLMGDGAESTKRSVRGFLQGPHSWRADGAACAINVRSVRITSQPVGAMFDYLLTDGGEMPSSRQAAFRGEIGILGIGMNTVELLVVRKSAPVQRFTACKTLGVRRLLELLSQREHYSLAELDAQLREGTLDVAGALPIWRSEILGYIERCWGSSHQRFGCVVLAGGGARLLRDALLVRFGSKAFIPDDPVIATARGLYKYTLMHAKGEQHG